MLRLSTCDRQALQISSCSTSRLLVANLALDHQPAPDRRRLVAPFERLGRWTNAIFLTRLRLRAWYERTAKPRSFCRPIVAEVDKSTLAFYTLQSLRLDGKRLLLGKQKKVQQHSQH